MQKHYKALKAFSSPLVGSVRAGDIIFYGEDSAKEWLKMGLAEEAQAKNKAETKKTSKK